MNIEEKGILEKELLATGVTPVGVDEVGRGCLAGRVYAGAVILDFQQLWAKDTSLQDLIRDSKMLSREQRAFVEPIIKAELAVSWAVAFAEVSEIEEIGIVQATFLAMRRALKKLVLRPPLCLLVDGRHPLPHFDGEQRAIIKGDRLCFTIAAASILAKEARDAYMREESLRYPPYNFAQHVGYATKEHLAALYSHGACSIHRKNFAPIKNM